LSSGTKGQRKIQNFKPRRKDEGVVRKGVRDGVEKAIGPVYTELQ